MRLKQMMAAIGLALTRYSGEVRANTIDLFYPEYGSAVVARITALSNGFTFLGYTSPLVQSPVAANLFYTPNSSQTTERNFASFMTGEPVGRLTNYIRTEYQNATSAVFTVSLQYFIISTGYGTAQAAFRNLSGGPLTLQYTDISPYNYPFFGLNHVSQVPLPASLPLFGIALMALGTVGYRLKRKNVEAAS